MFHSYFCNHILKINLESIGDDFMSVMDTDRWLQKLRNNPLKVCDRLREYFPGVTTIEICQHLTMHGMYQPPLKEEKVKKLQKNDVWGIVRGLEYKLRKKWSGPDIPIFIFPSDSRNQELTRHFNGKSGLAFVDKLFLFVSEKNTENDIRALFIHEYNHICRLTKFKKKENDYTLLDTIILEGLAENAVFECLGEKYISEWATYYSDNELKKMWKQFILPSSQLSKNKQKHQQLLFGRGFYPNMAGYAVGYFLVQQYIKKNDTTSEELFGIPPEVIAQVHEDEDIND